MTTIQISPAEVLKSFVNRRARRDQDRQRMRNQLLEGAASAPTDIADDAYFDTLRQRVREVASG